MAAQVRWFGIAVLAMLMAVSALQFSSCGAAERRASPASVFTDVPEPELPMASDIEGTEPAAMPVLTR